MPVAKSIPLFPLSIEQAIDLLLLLKAAAEHEEAAVKETRQTEI